MKTTSKCCNSPIIKDKASGYLFCTNCCGITNGNHSKFWWFLLILLIGSLFLVKQCKAPNLIYNSIYSMHNALSNDIDLNDSSILKELVKNHCILPSIAIAQSRIETGNYTSDICIENKNLFGIKAHKCKYVKGVNKDHATFKSYKDNIACYCHIQQRYLKSIDKSYATDSSYITKIKQFK